MLSIVSTGFSGAYFQASIRNENIAALNLEGVRLEWPKHALFPNMYADLMQWQGQTHWDGTDTTPPTITGAAPGPGTDATWISSANVRLNGNSTATWQVRFANGPYNMSAYYNRPDFTGSTWYFSNGCVLSYSEATPTPIPRTPTYTPTPVCGTYNLRFEAFWPHGVVQFSITNPGGTPIQITGIDMHWIYYYSGMNLDFISIGGTNAFDPATVTVWNGNDVGATVGAATTTATGTLGSEPTWLINATVNVGDTVYMWLDYDGTSESLDTGYGAKDYTSTARGSPSTTAASSRRPSSTRPSRPSAVTASFKPPLASSATTATQSRTIAATTTASSPAVTTWCLRRRPATTATGPAATAATARAALNTA
jgi:hypothetical protein